MNKRRNAASRRKRRGKKLFYIYSLAFIFFAALLYLVIVNNSVITRNYTVSYDSLPDAFSGYKIAVVSDIHDKLSDSGRKIIKKLKKSEPDIVVIAGDLHDEKEPIEPVTEFLSALTAEYTVLYVEGNHDSYSKAVRSAIRKTGVIILNGNSETVERDGEKINFSGASWHFYGDITPELSDGFNVWVLHDPLIYDEIEEKPELMLSGHVHGGFLRLPFVGGVFSPGYGASVSKRFTKSLLFPEYSKGIYGSDGKYLAVSVGYGNSVVPFRILFPEIMIVTLDKSR